MIDIVFILPYATLFKDVQNAFQSLRRDDIHHTILTVNNSEEELIPKLTGDVLIARGFASRFFQSKKPKSMLSVEIATSGTDIIHAIHKCIKQYNANKIAIIGNKTIIDSSQQLEDLFDSITIKTYLIDERSNVPYTIKQAIDDECNAIIGGNTVCKASKELDFPSTLISTGSEAIAKSLSIAIQLVEETRKEHEQYDRIAKIMQYSYGGIISIDSIGTITDINRKACSIFKTTEKESIGKSFSDLLPQIDISSIIKKNQVLKDEICKTDFQLLTLNCVPIAGDYHNSGAVITCMEAKELQKTEAKIRKSILDKGFLAKYSFDDIIHQSNSMEQAIHKAQQFSKNESNIFLHGETGVGKELFAQSIHNASHRKSGPFVAINCAALPEQLLESELFGYDEGAFTGASKSGKIGLFEAAHHGTIFLDEIGDLSFKLQGRLLRVLQEREIVRLGGDHVIPIDVRVISATNKDLIRECESEHFRSDLMYRLEVLKLTIPPLRSRRDDIIPLFLSFTEEICLKENKPFFHTIDPEASTLLQNYPWKGNVRQLRNISERICVLCEDDVINSSIVAEALELEASSNLSTNASETVQNNSSCFSEYDMIRDALEKNLHNKGKTASYLKMDRSTLWRKMKKYNLE